VSIVIPGRTVKYAWTTYQVVDDRNPPTLNTLHEVFSATGGVRLVNIAVHQFNTPTDAEEIDIVITLDGTAYTYDGSAIGMLDHNKEYEVFMWASGVTAYPAYTVDVVDTSGALEPFFAMHVGTGEGGKPIERHSIKVEVRQTSPIEAGARIRTKVTYEVLEAV